MMYLSPMTTSTSSSDFPSPSLRCRYCGHEHQTLNAILVVDSNGYPSEQGRPGATVLCADESACERRMARWPQPDDAELPGIDPPFDYSEPEGQPDDFYGSDAAFDEHRMDQGWDD